MRDSDFRRVLRHASLVPVLTIGLAAAPSAVEAQGTNPPPPGATQVDYDDDDMDFGWIGLLGLAGLLGLRRRDKRTDYPNTADTTTRRP